MIDQPARAELSLGQIRALTVARGRRPVLSARAPGALSVDWSIERDGMLYLSLEDEHEAHTVVALRMNAAPHVSIAWCHASPSSAQTITHGVFATKSGPLLVRTGAALVAIRPDDGEEAWTIPWTNAGMPFTLLDLDRKWVVCDRDIAAFDPSSGEVLWRKTIDADVVTECRAHVAHVAYATRRCSSSGCTPYDAGVLDASTGKQRWNLQNTIGVNQLLLVDHDNVVVAQPPGVVVLDARTGASRGSLALTKLPFAAEVLSSGDALLHGDGTLRVTIPGLQIRWRLDNHFLAKRCGQRVVAPGGEAKTGSSWIDTIDLDTGKKRRIQLTRSTGRPPYEFDRESILGSSNADADVDVESEFGWWSF